MNGFVRKAASNLDWKRGALALGLAICGHAALASPVELLANGGFETGNLAGWTASSSNTNTGGCDTGWNVSTSGGATGCFVVSNPLSGSYAAYQSFDGTGPKTRTLSQSFVVPTLQTALFRFFDTYEFEVAGDSEIPRTLDVNLVSASGTDNIYHFATPTGVDTGLRPWSEQDLDVTAAMQALQGQMVTLSIVTTIPENFSGPAGFGLDNLSLSVIPGSTVPEPFSLALVGLGLVGLGVAQRRRR